MLKCAWLGLLALLLVPQAGSVLNGISYVSNRWVWAFTMLEAFILARVCPGITAFEPKEKRNLFALLGDYCVTEAGFGADLGAEKFLDIKCRYAGMEPSAVTSTRTPCA